MGQNKKTWTKLSISEDLIRVGFMIKIMIVDDDIIVRKGISGILENIIGVSVVAEAESGEEALTLARGQALDIVFVDIQMPGIGGYETMQRLLHHYPKLKVVVLSVFSSGLYPRRFLSSGASGYLTKGASSDELEKAIKKIHAGGGIYYAASSTGYHHVRLR